VDQCINIIVKYLKLLNIKSSKKYEKKRKILASEVSGKSILKTNVDDIKGQIKTLEDTVQETPTKKLV